MIFATKSTESGKFEAKHKCPHMAHLVSFKVLQSCLPTPLKQTSLSMMKHYEKGHLPTVTTFQYQFNFLKPAL